MHRAACVPGKGSVIQEQFGETQNWIGTPLSPTPSTLIIEQRSCPSGDFGRLDWACPCEEKQMHQWDLYDSFTPNKGGHRPLPWHSTEPTRGSSSGGIIRKVFPGIYEALSRPGMAPIADLWRVFWERIHQPMGPNARRGRRTSMGNAGRSSRRIQPRDAGGSRSPGAVLWWCFGALYDTHIASSSHLTWKLMSTDRYEIIFVRVP